MRTVDLNALVDVNPKVDTSKTKENKGTIKDNKAESKFENVLKDKIQVKDLNDTKSTKEVLETKDETKDETIEDSNVDEIMVLLTNILNDVKVISKDDNMATNEVSEVKNDLSTLVNNLNENVQVLDKLNNSDNTKNITNSIMELLNSNNLDEITKVLSNELNKDDIKTFSDSLNSLVKIIDDEINSSPLNSNFLSEKPKEVIDIINKLTVKLNNLNNVNTDKKDNSVVNNYYNNVEYTQEETIIDNNTNSSDSKNDNSSLSKSLEKEDKILNSILKDDDSSKVVKFTMVNSNKINNTTVITEPTIINKETMAEDVVKNIKYMSNNSIKELMVRINPKELGEMVIKIVQEEGTTRAELKAASKDTYNLLNQNSENIKKYLSDQNIRIQNVDISLYEDTTFFKEQTSSNNPFRENSGRENYGREVSAISETETDTNYQEDEEISNINMLA